LSLLLALAAAAALVASASGGFFVASRRQAQRAKKEQDKGGGDKSEKAPPPKDAFASLPFSVGDVVVVDGEERWLSGGVLAKEGSAVVAALFFAPEGAATKAVAVFCPPRKEIYWLAPSRADSPSEPPASIEIDGVPMTRRGRLPVSLTRHGQGAPTIGDAGIFAEYDGGADEVAVVLTSNGRAFAWSGRRVHEGSYDRLGHGGDG
jgi:hypothetical protein